MSRVKEREFRIAQTKGSSRHLACPAQGTKRMRRVVYVGEFRDFPPCNHFINIKKKILFPAKQKTEHFLPFIFRFIRELNLYSPPYLLPHLRARTQTYTPPLTLSLRPTPSPSPSAKTFGFTHPRRSPRVFLSPNP